MTTLSIYLIKAVLLNALMLGVYHFCIRPQRNFALMRSALLASIVLPLLLPLIPPPVIYRGGSEIPIYVISLPEITIASKAPTPPPAILPLLPRFAYYAISLLLLGRIAVSIHSIFRKQKSSKVEQTTFGKIYIDQKAVSPFSFFKWVFFPPDSLKKSDAALLLRHEFSHVRRLHSIDRLLSLIFKALFWFSPLAYLNHRLLSETHEYQADADTIIETEDKSAYNQLMLAYAGIQPENHLNHSFSKHLKKRIIMLYQSKPKKMNPAAIGAAAVLVIIFTLLTAMIQPNKLYNTAINDDITGLITNLEPSKNAFVELLHPSSTSEDTNKRQTPSGEVFTVVEEMPEFPGGAGAMVDFLRKNLEYPEAAKKDKIEGRVFASFIVETDGSISNVVINRGINPLLDRAAIDAIEAMPHWKPGKQRGIAVRTKMNIPVHFALNKESEKSSTPTTKSATPITKNKKNTINLADGREVYTLVDKMPKFPGGNEEMMKYLSSSIIYPEEARKAKKEGRVYVNFIVEADGSITNVNLLRGISKILDDVAVDVIRKMPNWTPGEMNGIAVPVSFNIPINFVLEQNERQAE